jgi:type 1 glutamine amidotransferase
MNVEMKILILTGDYWHPSEVIRAGLATWEGVEPEWIENAHDILTLKRMQTYPVVMNCKSNQISTTNTHPWFDSVSEIQVSDLRSYIEAGGSFLSVHSGNAFPESDESGYTSLIGNAFIGHPARCDVLVTPSNSHPIAQGISPFTIRDEHYQIAMKIDDYEPFLTTTSSEGGTQIGGYTRRVGKGRICVLTPGHVQSVWEHPSFRKLLDNALCWCGAPNES